MPQVYAENVVKFIKYNKNTHAGKLKYLMKTGISNNINNSEQNVFSHLGLVMKLPVYNVNKCFTLHQNSSPSIAKSKKKNYFEN